MTTFSNFISSFLGGNRNHTKVIVAFWEKGGGDPVCHHKGITVKCVTNVSLFVQFRIKISIIQGC